MAGTILTQWKDASACRERLAHLAVTALIEEAELTPKPGLVDKKSTGSHTDLNIGLMLRSARALRGTFSQMADAAFQRQPSQFLREELAEIGRCGEQAMLEATGGTNTHKGAIWALGLLTASAAMHDLETSPEQLAKTAGAIARYPDRWMVKTETNGSKVRQRYGVAGAGEEAEQGFPHVINIALPILQNARDQGITELNARLDALVALIVHLDDTCILHRGGMQALLAAKSAARSVLNAGGTSTPEGWDALHQLNEELLARNASPGGSADLLAAALFLDSLSRTTLP
jgi:triphosphoribosyl-dephospho-CoA synthase